MAEIPNRPAHPLVVARATSVGQGPFDAAPDPFEPELPRLNRDCFEVNPCRTGGCDGPRALVAWTPGYRIVCEGCGAEGDWKNTPPTAVYWWNANRPHGKPEPAPDPGPDEGAGLPACPVPGCGGAAERVTLNRRAGTVQVRCNRCKTAGPMALSLPQAEAGWGMLCELAAKGGAVPILSEAERYRWLGPVKPGAVVVARVLVPEAAIFAAVDLGKGFGEALAEAVRCDAVGPCATPDCGGVRALAKAVDFRDLYQVACEGCGAAGLWEHTPAFAVKAWNATRPAAEPRRAWCAPGGTLGRLHRPITEDWLRANGFAIESGRADPRHPIRSLPVSCEKPGGKWPFEASDDLCIDVAPDPFTPKGFSVWVAQREPYRHIHVRTVFETHEIAALFAGLTGNLWPGTL